MGGPIIVIIIITTIFIAGISLYVWWNWNKIVMKLKGKRIAILGSEGVGKTTLNDFLHGGEIEREHKFLKPYKLKLKDLSLYVKEGEDVGGDDSLAKWKEVFIKSDITIYLFNSKKVYNGDNEYIDEIINHMRILNSWREDNKKKIQMFMIGTYADLIDGMGSKKSARFINRKLKEDIKPALNQGDIDHHKFIVGSLQGEINIQNLVESLILLLYKKI